jgi:transcriptional regulator with XRE-family HTH domain
VIAFLPRFAAASSRPRRAPLTPALPFCQFALKAQRPPQAGYPVRPASLGEHIKKRRLDLGLTQKEVARRVGVNPSTVLLWEQGRTEPAIRYVPGIVSLLGYDPLPTGASFPEQLRSARTRLGLSQRRLAEMLDVDEGTVRRWESGRSRPWTLVADRLAKLCAFARPPAAGCS